jgi:hypothetical protein
MLAKKQVVAMLLAWCSLGVAVSADTVVLIKKDNCGVYQNRIRKLFEAPLFSVSTQDRLLVLETKDDRYFIRDREGREGWIEKSLCVRAPRSATYTYDPVELTVFHPQVSPIWIPGDPLQPGDGIYLERSFTEELRSNTDRESLERQAVR